MSIDLLATADGLRRDRVPFVLATVVRAERPTSARPGDRAVVLADGTIDGFVGGACAASTLRAQSALLLRAGGTTLLRITPAGEGAAVAAPPPGTVVVDNPCLSGGTMEILLEAVMPAALLYVFGDTPIARALVEVARAAGYDVRAATDPAAPVPADAAAVVVASHGHHEPEVVRAALAAGVPYLALVASPKRGAAVLAELSLPPAAAARVKTPAGLDIGARTPGEIAVSILAEVVSRRAGEPEPAAAVQPAEPAAAVQPAEPAATSGPAQPVTATDPVCGMTVAVSPHTLSYDHSGRTWYFCAAGCRKAFVEDSQRFVAGSA
jgi:xanthine dehydrogenase accessory factor